MFLQLVAGGHLLLFVTRTEGWFFRPPFPALPLLAAILATQALAVLMCGFGWLVPAIPWKTIAWVWAYNLVWLLSCSAASASPPSGCSTTGRSAASGAPPSSTRRCTPAAG